MLAKHGAIYLIAKIFPAIIALGLMAILTRNLTPEEYGLYSLTILTAGFIVAVFLQWISLGVGRFLPECKNKIEEKALLGTARVTLAIVLALLSPVFLLLYLFEDSIPFSILFKMLCFLVFAQAWFELNLKIMNASLDPIRYAWILAVKSLLSLAFIYLLITFDYGVEGVVWALISALFLSTLLGVDSWKNVSWIKIDKPQIKKIAVYGLPLISTYVLKFLIDASDRFFIDKLLGAEALGTYSAAYDFTQYAIGTLVVVVHLAAFPLVMNSYTKNGIESAQFELKKVFVFVFLVLAPITVGTILVSDNLASTLLGQQYVEVAINVIPLIAFGMFFNYLRAFYFDYAFQLASATSYLLLTIAIAAGLNLLLNFLLIPKYELLGAAWATIISFAVALVASIFLGRRVFAMPNLPSLDILKIIIAVLVMGLIVFSINSSSMYFELTMQIILGGGAYLIFIIGLNILNIRNWLWLKLKSLN